MKLWWWWTIIVLPLSGESIGWYGRVYNIYYQEYNICRSYVCIFLHHAIEILYILLICMNILNANYIILLYCTTSFSDIAPRRQALTFACLDRCSPSRHTAGSRNNVANMHVCFAGHMFQGHITSKRQCMHAYKQRCETCRPTEERVDIQNHDDMHGCLANTYISGIGKYSHDDFHGRRNMVCMLWSSRWQERRGVHAMIFTLTGTWCARESKHVELDIPLLVNHLTARLSYIHSKHIWQVSKRSI